MKQVTTRVKPALTQAEIEELESLLIMEANLPHIYGFPWYRWAKEFYESQNRANFLCAANQVSKSSTQIRRAIRMATEVESWKKWWPDLLPGQKPNQFWYFYPTFDVWQTEFETKWEPDFLPRGPYKDDPVFGWKATYEKGLVKKIEFNSGVTIYCKAYSQKIKDLQSGSVHAMFLDEECPVEFMPELQARLRATNGYLHAVFTATLGQEYWRRVMEPKNKDEEIYTGAWKRSVSLYDSMEYIDGKKSRWTEARIKRVIQECPTDADVQRRVFGRFVKSEGLKFESFDLERNMCAPGPFPKSWGIFAAVDPGSGGKSGHPAGIIFIAVRPDYREGIIFRGWRGDGIPTANPDILRKFRELKGKMLTMAQVYDYRDKDFFLVAQSQGEPFQPANKAREEGFGLLNSLFKNGMLKVQSGDPELDKLVGELMSLPAVTDSRKKDLDDLSDALRYVCMAVPWDFSHVSEPVDLSKFNDEPVDSRTDAQRFNDELNKDRRKYMLSSGREDSDNFDNFGYWNDLMGAGND
jgi:hypothetical protein